MKFHREGHNILYISTLLALAGTIFSITTLPLCAGIPVTITVLALLLMIFRFFRIPVSRRFTADESLVMAPADGNVVVIENTPEEEYFNDRRIQVSIFMSIHDVHINWFPVSGTLVHYTYHPGKYLVARHPKSSTLNERNTIVIQNSKTTLLVRQIAGFVARRIRFYHQPGDAVNQSGEMGFIRFGSRVDLFLPENVEILVTKGQQTKGGITPVARLK